MTFAYTVTINDPAHAADDGLLRSNTEAALADWSRYIDGVGVLDYVVNVASVPVGIANGGAATTVYISTDGSRNVFESGTDAELNSGTDPNGTAYDASITIDPKTFAILADRGSLIT